MPKFKNHTYFAKPRDVQNYLFPHVCLNCRKCFRKPASLAPRLCPQCAAPMTQLSRKFKAPRSRDVAQWDKVKFLVLHGFTFYPVYERIDDVMQRQVPYPVTLAEAREFVKIRLCEANGRGRAPAEWSYSPSASD